MTVFYTKKAKAKWRSRKRKMIKAGGDGDADGNDHHEHELSTADNDDGSGPSKSRNRKRTSDQISNCQKHQINVGKHSSSDGHEGVKSGNQQQQSATITIPANLTSKETKKFRKDARRKARVEGQPEDQIKFVIEGQEPEPPEEGEEDKKKTKRAKKEFPRINDLLSQHATQQKLDEKKSKQKSINDALPPSEKEMYVAIDCEMVGIGTDGVKSALARASAVNWEGKVLFDTFVRVPERVTDFRTFVSGVRPKDIHVKNTNAMDHEECRLAVGKLLMNKVLVGHALKNDLSALMLTHPKSDIRDTAKYKPFMRATGRSGGKLRPRKLRDLVYEQVGKKIQVEGEAHDSIDDARASMELFQCVKGKWEKELMGKKNKKGKK